MARRLVQLEVSVSAFRQDMRRWLDAVGRGEEIVLTERGRPVARVARAESESAYDRLVREGVITPAKRPRRPDSAYPPRVKARGSVSEFVKEQRR